MVLEMGGCSIFSQYINTSVTQPQGEHNGGGFSRPTELIFLHLRKANDCFCVNANLLFPHWPELISSGICKDLSLEYTFFHFCVILHESQRIKRHRQSENIFITL